MKTWTTSILVGLVSYVAAAPHGSMAVERRIDNITTFDYDTFMSMHGMPGRSVRRQVLTLDVDTHCGNFQTGNTNDIWQLCQSLMSGTYSCQAAGGTCQRVMCKNTSGIYVSVLPTWSTFSPHDITIQLKLGLPPDVVSNPGLQCE